MSKTSRIVLGTLAALTCVAFAARIAVDQRPTEEISGSRDFSALEQLAATGQVQAIQASESGVSVWSSNFDGMEPALHAAAGDGEIRLMTGVTCVGTYTRRAGIKAKDAP